MRANEKMSILMHWPNKKNNKNYFSAAGILTRIQSIDSMELPMCYSGFHVLFTIKYSIKP